MNIKDTDEQLKEDSLVSAAFGKEKLDGTNESHGEQRGRWPCLYSAGLEIDHQTGI